jgi:ribonuclease R
LPEGLQLSSEAKTLLRTLQKIRRRLTRPDKLANELAVSIKELDRHVDELIQAGLVVRGRQGRIGLASRMGLVTGTVRVGRGGRGVVIPDEPDKPIGLPRGGVRPAMHGDRVLVEVEPHTSGGLQRGTIKEILERAQTRIIGVVHGETGDEQLVVPGSARFGDPARALPDGLDVTAGMVVSAQIVEHPTSYRSAIVRIDQILGESGTLKTEIESVRVSLGIEAEFSAAAEREAAAAAAPELGADAGADRLDLRDQPTVTIDPSDARDFDDAVAVEHTDNGYRLTVSIADVSFYVRAGTALDREAAERATSVYFPGRCVPMLPERISGDVASLRPGEDRFALSAILEIDSTGRVESQRFARTLIRSDDRLTYEQAEQCLDGDGDSGPTDLVRLLWDCASVLLSQRMQRGAIDLDIPEAAVELDDDGEPVTIHQRTRLRAHRLVEECMLAANEAVARALEQADLPFLYRVHERPDSENVSGLAKRISSLGLRFERDDSALTSKSLQAVISKARAKPFERLVHVMVLRSMTRARYDPYKQIHFGLASSCYTHFTSPIRRYPDLIAHRALCSLINASDEVLPSRESLVSVGVHCSERERRAAEAERETVRVAGVLVMQSRIGETFNGMVTGVERYGFFVELEEPFIEGFVPVAKMPEYYEYVADRLELWSRNSTSRIRIGDRMRVRLTACDLVERRMEFEPSHGE